jgi:hypothetical protein
MFKSKLFLPSSYCGSAIEIPKPVAQSCHLFSPLHVSQLYLFDVPWRSALDFDQVNHLQRSEEDFNKWE